MRWQMVNVSEVGFANRSERDDWRYHSVCVSSDLMSTVVLEQIGNTHDHGNVGVLLASLKDERLERDGRRRERDDQVAAADQISTCSRPHTKH